MFDVIYDRSTSRRINTYKGIIKTHHKGIIYFFIAPAVGRADPEEDPGYDGPRLPRRFPVLEHTCRLQV